MKMDVCINNCLTKTVKENEKCLFEDSEKTSKNVQTFKRSTNFADFRPILPNLRACAPRFVTRNISTQNEKAVNNLFLRSLETYLRKS